MTTTRSGSGGSRDVGPVEADNGPSPSWKAEVVPRVFVGREREIARLAARIADARQGRGSIVALSGEAGIGKTRVAREAARRATGAGFTVLWTRELDGDWQPPYRSWIEVVAQGVQSQASVIIDGPPPGWVAPLAAMSPFLRHLFPAVSLPGRLSPQEERFRLSDAIVHCLADLSVHQPIMIVLDDIQWCDPESLVLLRFISNLPREHSLLILVLLRDDELGRSVPLAETVSHLRREDRFEELRLSGLSGPDVERLVNGLAERDVATDLIRQIGDGTRGNPFFVEEVVRHLAEEGRLVSDGARPAARPGRLVVPDSLRLVVDHRLARLSAATQRLLRLAAVCTDGFEFDVLSALTGLADEPLLTAIDEALAAHLIAPVDSSTERYDFPHALIRGALYDSWSPSRRARLHRQLAVSLEQIHGPRAGQHAAELAIHYHVSNALPGAEVGIPHALTAARAAERGLAPDQAVSFFRIARDLASGLPSIEQARILAELAVAEARAFWLDDAFRTIDQALWRFADGGASPAEIARFLAAAVTGLHDGGASPAEWLPLVHRGLALAPPGDALTWSRLTLLIPRWEPIISGNVNGSRWLGSDPRAVEIAQSSGDEDLFARSMQPWDLHDRSRTESLTGLTRSWQRPEAIIRALTVCGAFWLFHDGDLHRARRHFEHLLAVADRHGSIQGQAEATVRLTLIHTALGDLVAARVLRDRAARLVVRLGPDHRLQASLWWLTALQTEFDGDDWDGVVGWLVPYIANPAVGTRTTAIDDAALAALALTRSGHADQARQLLVPLADLVGQADPTMWLLNGAVGFGAAAVWSLAARDLAPPFRDAARAVIASGHGDFPGASTWLSVARMAALLGDDRDADQAFDQARSQLDRSGQRPVRAMVDLDQGTAITRRSHGDPARARSLARQAAERFTELGMARWAARAQALLGDIVHPVEPTRRVPAGLTGREVDVVRLVARGSSDRQIGEQLFVSPRTIHAHLRNILAKTGLANRTELSVWAHENDLAGAPARPSQSDRRA